MDKWWDETNEAELELRKRLAEVGRTLFDDGLTHGASGNISARIPSSRLCLIKPSGHSLGELAPKHFIVVDIDTRKVVSGTEKPSIETPFHTAIYRLRPEVGGIVHMHPRYATILSITGEEIIPMSMDIFEAPALAKGIALAKFAQPGSDALAESLAEALRDRVAALMPHHGVTAIGGTIEEAAQNARVVERLAQLHYEVALIGKPKPLPDSLRRILVEMAEKQGLLV
jgi:L-fuculose-phosphate aldolase